MRFWHSWQRDDVPLDPGDGVGQRQGFIFGRTDEVIGQPLGALGANARGVCGVPAPAWPTKGTPRGGVPCSSRDYPRPGIFKPPVIAPIFSEAISWVLVKASFTAAATRS